MAHFAELESKTDPTGFTSDTHLVVKRVVVVGNDIPANGGILENNDMHADGETWCQNFFGGGTWKQTSYNSKFRKQYAGIGMIYDGSKNWQAPVTYPEGDQSAYIISWDEDNTRWTGVKLSDESNHRWDASAKEWVSI